MSIKIYNGYVLPKFTFDELHEFSKKAKSTIESLAEKKYNSIFARDLIYKIDDIAVNANGSDIIFDEKYTGDSLYLGLWLHYVERINKIKATDSRDPEIDFDTCVVYIPLEDKILAWFVTEQRKFREAWESLPEVKEYAYWDNSDKPKKIKQKDWSQRLIDWEKGLDLSCKVSDCGFKRVFVSNDVINLPRHENILAEIPSFENRLKRVAQNEYIDKYMITERSKLTPEELKNYDSLIRFYNKAIKNIREGLVTDVIEENKEKFKQLLTESFDKDLLFEKTKVAKKLNIAINVSPQI